MQWRHRFFCRVRVPTQAGVCYFCAMQQLHLPFEIAPFEHRIGYTDKVLLIGSCFTEHIADRLAAAKFRVLGNPNGILFNPWSVADSLNGYVDGRQYQADDLFHLNDLWNSWDHHTRFSHIDRNLAVDGINASQQAAHAFVKEAGFVIITLGSAFQYYLKEGGRPVANNHRAPGQWFEKRLLTINAIVAALARTIENMRTVNPNVKVIFTISPVRHIRDGVVDNNRSKARLIEAVHELCGSLPAVNYFPAYELLIDVLRDYRFYDIDFVHPNFLATGIVWDYFVDACISPACLEPMAKVMELVTSAAHRSRFPDTDGHKRFLAAQYGKACKLEAAYPFLDCSIEKAYFQQGI